MKLPVIYCFNFDDPAMAEAVAARALELGIWPPGQYHNIPVTRETYPALKEQQEKMDQLLSEVRNGLILPFKR